MTYELKNISIGYRTKKVSEHINATLREGELCCLLGPNGAGKSTLLRTLSAFQPPLNGEIRIDGTPLSKMSPKELSKCVGVVLTERIEAHGMSVPELVGMGRSPYTNFWGRMTEEDRVAVREAMQMVDILSLQDRLVSTLSDGERQKVMIAKALAQGTPIILLDEPTAFLDFPSKVETMLLLRNLCRQMHKTILLSTHDLDLALQTADVLWLLKDGQPLYVGNPKELAAKGTLSQFFQSEHTDFDPKSLRFTIHF